MTTVIIAQHSGVRKRPFAACFPASSWLTTAPAQPPSPPRGASGSAHLPGPQPRRRAADEWMGIHRPGMPETRQKSEFFRKSCFCCLAVLTPRPGRDGAGWGVWSAENRYLS